MLAAALIFAAACLFLILGVLYLPKLRLGPLSLDSYWIPPLLGAALSLALGLADVSAVGAALLSDSAVNPVKILVLFLSMTVLSVFLDEQGFFRYLAAAVLRRAEGGQRRLFLILYLTVAVLTVFTSNDVIILSFTPFICYFAKNASIDPMPYLAAEFVAANTWSMALVIGNPTNIYLATAAGVDFVSYLRVMLLPTLLAGTVGFLVLYRIYRTRLRHRMSVRVEPERVEDPLLLTVGLVHLAACTLLLAVGSYIGLEMWLVALGSVLSLFLFVGGISLVRRRRPRALAASLARAPWPLIPFVLSMFVLILVLGEVGATELLAAWLAPLPAIPAYGALSFLASNLVNNIPMSVLFSGILAAGDAGMGGMYATVIGSNIGAFLTPIGALAGIMFGTILRRHGHAFGYREFLKLGVTVAIPSLAAALFGLFLVLA
jgi:arsenical pump membrane protein